MKKSGEDFMGRSLYIDLAQERGARPGGQERTPREQGACSCYRVILSGSTARHSNSAMLRATSITLYASNHSTLCVLEKIFHV